MLILGILILTVVILAVVIAVIRRVIKDSPSDLNVCLTKTYTNEAEGISFQYPSVWSNADIAEYNNNQAVIENTVVLLVNEDEQGIYSMFHISKYRATQELINTLFIEDEKLAKLYDGVSISKTSITKIGGIDARMVTYVDKDGLYHQNYLYNIRSDLYWLDFICPEDIKYSAERFFDAVVGSYTVTVAASATPNQNVDICFNDIPVQELLGLSAAELARRFEGSYSFDNNNGMMFNEHIVFNMKDDETVDSIWIYGFDKFSINGEYLKVNGEGVIEGETVINLFGQDYKDEWLDIGYYMSYYYPEYTLSFEINKYNELCRIMLRKPSDAGADLGYGE